MNPWRTILCFWCYYYCYYYYTTHHISHLLTSYPFPDSLSRYPHYLTISTNYILLFLPAYLTYFSNVLLASYFSCLLHRQFYYLRHTLLQLQLLAIFCITTPTTIRHIQPTRTKKRPNRLHLDFLQTTVFRTSILHSRSSRTIPCYCLSRPNYIGTHSSTTTLVPHISTEHLPPNSYIRYSYQTSTSSLQSLLLSFSSFSLIEKHQHKWLIPALNHIIDLPPKTILSFLFYYLDSSGFCDRWRSYR